MDISPSSKTQDSSVVNNNTTNVNTETSTFQPQNDEEPPPPYPTDSNIQIPTPSHSRDHTTITLSLPPEYTSSTSFITTQPQPQIMSLSPNNNRLSDVSMTSTTNEDTSNHTLLINSAQQIKFCKICQESEESDSEDSIASYSETYKKGKLISPCKCKGSLQYVHIGCLNQWRNSNVREEASYRCE
ncbi:RING finger domain protein [Rhizophagus clarus]|nr:RING finger domain protein [Rhizophagus clarus]